MIVRPYEYWESDRTIDYISTHSNALKKKLVSYYNNNYSRVASAPYLTRDEIEQYKFLRIKHLVCYAYKNIEFYHLKYKREGVAPQDINNLSDLKYLPVVTKDELIDSFPNSCVDLLNFKKENLFATRSSGSSGKVVKLLYDRNAVFEDTIHGVRQWSIQSNNRYCKKDKVAMIYTCPWWFGNINKNFRSYFISSLLSVKEIVSVLYKIKPEIISCYPSVLNSIAQYLSNLSNLYLIVVHSEQSTQEQRNDWSKITKVPVLDEYSSEEATRISLQFPCGKYHICEDTVHVETISNCSMKMESHNKGEAVITNLLNTAMPIIRYVQGDIISLSESKCSCGANWSVIESLHGRTNDSFVTKYGKLIDSGVLIDITYRWMMETDLHIKSFMLSQVDFDCIDLSLSDSDYMDIKNKDNNEILSLKEWIEILFSHPVKLDCNSDYLKISSNVIKKKSIRCLLK